MTARKLHPLDPLTAAEISAATHACKQRLDGVPANFTVITLLEPPKADLISYTAGTGPLPRRIALVIMKLPPSPGVVEALVELSSGNLDMISAEAVLQWSKKEDVEPSFTPEDCLDAEAIGKADPEVQKLLKERYDITDLSKIAFDPWSVHAAPVPGRLVHLFTYYQSSPNDNAYAHPLDIIPIVDLNTRKVVQIDKYKSAPKVPMEDVNYHHQLYKGAFRNDIKPLDVVQPEGPSFSVEGNFIKWQKWQFRLGFNYREGIVLHQLGYESEGEVRPILHRISLVEMAVPYAEPRYSYPRKCAFDIGDYGLGYCALPLSLGCDCLGVIKYFDAVFPNHKGEPVVVPKVVCMHEEDVGLLWKHVDYRSGHSESRRGRRLVISSIATVVNYEYAFYWYLYQDGTITFEIKLTGELSTNVLSEGEPEIPEFGTLVAPGVNAQHHQHMFCARIDPAVDDPAGGRGVVVSEVEAVPASSGPKNPFKNQFDVTETDLLSTAEAQRMVAPERARIWKFKNPNVIHPITKKPVAYKLMPQNNPLLMAGPDSLVAKRGGFATKNLWVTPYSDDQKFPAGDYIPMSDTCQGLRVWTQGDKPLKDADPVVWYSFGITHIVRIEDFPVMPVETVGFTLKPTGFFAGNPGVDIPAGRNAASKECCQGGNNENGGPVANGSSNHAANGTANGTNGCHA